MSLDIFLFKFIFQFHGFSLLDTLAIFLSKYLPFILGLLAIVFIFKNRFWKKRWLVFIFLSLCLILSRGILTEAIRFFYYRPRPFEFLKITSLISESGAAFPSGHAAFLFALAFGLFYFNRRWGIWFFILAFLNGLARVFVGVHWPSDIFGGFLVAFLSFFLVKLLLSSILIKTEKEILATEKTRPL